MPKPTGAIQQGVVCLPYHIPEARITQSFSLKSGRERVSSQEKNEGRSWKKGYYLKRIHCIDTKKKARTIMTTRALEDSELKSIFSEISGAFALRNETMLVVGIGLALRAAELVLLQVGDVFDGEQVKTYITIRGETAKFGKEREIRVWDIVREKLGEFISWKKSNGESLSPSAPLFVSREGGHLWIDY